MCGITDRRSAAARATAAPRPRAGYTAAGSTRHPRPCGRMQRRVMSADDARRDGRTEAPTDSRRRTRGRRLPPHNRTASRAPRRHRQRDRGGARPVEPWRAHLKRPGRAPRRGSLFFARGTSSPAARPRLPPHNRRPLSRMGQRPRRWNEAQNTPKLGRAENADDPCRPAAAGYTARWTLLVRCF